MVFKLHLGSIFRNRLHCGTLQTPVYGRYGDIYGTCQLYIRLIQDRIRNITGAHRHSVLMAGHHENRREQRYDKRAFALAESRVLPPLPGNTQRTPRHGSIFMNLSANMLGLDNAATPMGLKAMKELQELNPKKDTATNPMIMFLVMNTSGLILIPVSIMMYRSQMGAAQPTDIFIPTLITTAISTIVGVTAVSIAQRINLLNKPILILIGCISLFFSGLIYLFTQVSREEMGVYSTLVANIILFTIILLFILWGLWKKINVYDAFIEGAKEGFTTAIRIVPYLVAFLVGIAVFRTSGAMDIIVNGIGYIVGLSGADTEFVGALPTALMKSLSGSGANGLMIDTMKQYGADSFVGA